MGAMRSHRMRRGVGALALAAAIVLAGCGGDDSADPVPGSSTPAAAAGPTAAPAPVVDETDQGDEADDPIGGDEAPVDESDQGDEADQGDQGDEANDPNVGDEAPVDESDQGDEANDPGTGSDGSTGLAPGDPCSLEEGSPDCIDPDGDGEGVYLRGGADCVAMYADASFCADLDGDGYAGYPDSEGTTYPDSEALPGEPCSKEEGSPDCIDADGDGEGVILWGGEECVAMYADESFCADTDGDGYAGETDPEGNLPYPYEG